MTKRSYMISVKMHSPELSGGMHTHELYVRTNSQELGAFLHMLNGAVAVDEFSLYATTEIPNLHKFKTMPFDLGIEDLAKFK